MSMTPNNPFETTPSNQASGPGQPQKKGSKAWIWIIGIIGVVGLVGAIACCGGGYALFNLGTGMLAEAFKQQLDGNPVIEEQIGQIESLEMNLSKTAQQGQNSNGERIAFDIKGSKASGTILIKQDKSGDGTGIESAELILADGSRFDVPLDSMSTSGVFEVDLGEVDPGLPEVDLPEVDLPEVDLRKWICRKLKKRVPNNSRSTAT